MFVLKLAIFETGIAEIHDMMTLNVPRGLKFIAVTIVLMGCITSVESESRSSGSVWPLTWYLPALENV